jgi:hypothetical protein
MVKTLVYHLYSEDQHDSVVRVGTHRKVYSVDGLIAAVSLARVEGQLFLDETDTSVFTIWPQRPDLERD